LVKKHNVYNNTFLDNANNFMISAPEYWQIDVKNNLSIVYDKTHSHMLRALVTLRAGTLGPNQWSSIPEDKNWYSTSRDEISDPKLRKTSGWTMLKSSTDFSFKDLTPLINSTAIENPKAIILSKYSGFQEIFLTSGTDLSKMQALKYLEKIVKVQEVKIGILEQLLGLILHLMKVKTNSTHYCHPWELQSLRYNS
jgi:hypothetical protein